MSKGDGSPKERGGQHHEDHKCIVSKLEEAVWTAEYGFVGLRIQDVPFELGSMEHVSRRWADGEETEEELPGVSAVAASMARRVFLKPFPVEYFGNHVAIIAGDKIEYGEDEGEIIIADPVVIEIIA